VKKKEKKIQQILVITGLVLFILTYFYYPSSIEEKSDNQVLIDENLEKKDMDASQVNSFKNMEYKGVYDFNKAFKVKSKEAYILNDEPDIVYMKKMHVILNLNNGKVVNITSDKGRYNKVTYDCFFEENVFASDGETEIHGNNLDLLATEDSAKIYNNVTLNNALGLLKADKINYNFETKNFKVSMFDDELIKMKVVQ